MLDVKMEFTLSEKNPNISEEEFKEVISQFVNFSEACPFATMFWKLSFNGIVTRCGKGWIEDQLLDLLERRNELKGGAQITIVASCGKEWIKDQLLDLLERRNELKGGVTITMVARGSELQPLG